MSVSSGLQKYFDSQQKKKAKRDIDEKFWDLFDKIDPVFRQNFEKFHDTIIGIVQENPEEVGMIGHELEVLGKQIWGLQRKHDSAKLKKIVELV